MIRTLWQLQGSTNVPEIKCTVCIHFAYFKGRDTEREKNEKKISHLRFTPQMPPKARAGPS